MNTELKIDLPLALIKADTKEKAQLVAMSAIATPVTIERRDILLSRAKAITAITGEAQVKEVTEIAGLMKGLRNDVEAGRRQLKEPVLVIEAAIDGVAKSTMTEALSEMTRLEGLLGAYHAEQERLRKAEIRRQEEDARRAREEAERKAKEAQEAADKARKEAEAAVSSDGKEDLVAALDKEIAAEEAAEKAREAAAAVTAPVYMPPVAAVPKVSGAAVKTQWDYEVVDISALYQALPVCVELKARPMAIKDAIKSAEQHAGGLPFSIPGLKLFKSTKVATRAR